MVKKILSILLLLISLPVLFVCIVILSDFFLNPNEIPSFLGWKPFIMQTDTMEPEICSGDLILVQESDVYSKDDIIAFQYKENMVVIERITDIIEKNKTLEFVTQEDNNSDKNYELVVKSKIEGKYKFKIPKLGQFILFIQSPLGGLICISIPFVLFLLLSLEEKYDGKKINFERRWMYGKRKRK